jgi:hypothetical protein
MLFWGLYSYGRKRRPALQQQKGNARLISATVGLVFESIKRIIGNSTIRSYII